MKRKGIEIDSALEIATPVEKPESTPTLTPAVDIFETTEAMIIIADMPGVAPENLDIDIDGYDLTIRGRTTRRPETGTYLKREFDCGDYLREFAVDAAMDLARIEASIKDGVLSLKIPKHTP